jgi:hypothetical protein
MHGTENLKKEKIIINCVTLHLVGYILEIYQDNLYIIVFICSFLLWNSVSWWGKWSRHVQSYHLYYLFVVCNHLEFGLCILEVDPVYSHSYQLENHACSKTGGSGLTLFTEILWFHTADLGEWHCSCCHNHLLILCSLLQVVTKRQKGDYFLSLCLEDWILVGCEPVLLYW